MKVIRVFSFSIETAFDYRVLAVEWHYPKRIEKLQAYLMTLLSARALSVKVEIVFLRTRLIFDKYH